MSREGNLKGTEREALVISDLARRGFETFTGNGNTTCDIIALKYGICIRVEGKGLRGHSRNPSGPVSMHGCRGGNNPDCEFFDVLARVGSQGEIIYQRSILHTVNAASADLPLRKENSKHTTKVNLSRANVLKEDK